MASVKESLRGFVSGSMGEASGGQYQPPAPAPRSLAQRQAEGRRRLDGAAKLDLAQIIRDPSQPRQEWEDREAVADLEALAESIRARGVMTPIQVRWSEADDRYMVVLGERRFRAAAMAGLTEIPVVVTAADATEEDRLEDQLVENALRAGLRPIDQANAYQRLIEKRGLTQQQLADRLHISQTTVSHALKLLKLPDAIQESVNDGTIAVDVGYRLTTIADPVVQAEAAGRAARGEVGRDEIRDQAKAARSKGRGAKAGPPKPWVRSTALGKLTLELKRDAQGPEIAAALRAAADKLDPPASADRQDAA